MMLSKNFSLAELIKSQTAERLGMDNSPLNALILDRLYLVAEKILQPVRDHYGVPVNISSGYRSPELNKITPRSSSTSQHVKGEAVDFEVFGKSNAEVARWIRDNLEFDQLILEFHRSGEPHSGWVHCSFSKDKNRKDVKTFSNQGKFIGIVG